tara:strand:- start:232 stop:1056 length:825 start_codon:yes stop_codon:yes gene_type:complete
VDVLLWVLFGLLPAIAAMLFFVGVGGPRWLALALAVAVCVPFGMADGWPNWFWRLDLMHGEPRLALWWTLLLGGLLGTMHDFKSLPRVINFGLEIGLVLMLPWLLSAPLRKALSFEACLVYLAAGWLLMAGLWLGLRRSAQAQPGLPVPLAMTIALAVDTWLLRENAGGPDWQLAGVAAVALGFAVITTIWRRPFVCGAGAALTITLLHTGLLVCGRSEQELLRLPFVLAWIAPLSMWLVVVPWFAKQRGVGACLAILLVATCGGFAVWLSAGA